MRSALCGPIIILITTMSAANAASAVVTIAGAPRTCGDTASLDRALSTRDSSYFQGWSDSDFNTARLWARTCISYGNQFAAGSREALIEAVRYQRQQAEATRANNAMWDARDAADKAERQREEALRRDRNAAHQAQEERNRAHAVEVNDCQQTHAYLLYQAQEAIIDDREGIVAAKQAIAQERRVGEISGAVDLTALHTSGEQIAQWSDDLTDNFKQYRQLGGRAENPQAVTHKLKNPCSQ